ncbi:hypothetical protein ACFXP3_25570 [Streptomyces sp. NPDC059096]|uniref:hypothetical protein n=1 Tax=Streptomyces sp. NPDC059096 TaxID=3346727 RepID=UPI00368EA2A4
MDVLLLMLVAQSSNSEEHIMMKFPRFLRRLATSAVFHAVRGAAYACGAAAVAGLGWWVDRIF